MLNDKIFSPLKVHNVIDINSIFTFYLMTASKDFSFAGETHNFWEIDYVLKGKVGFTNEEMLFERQEGDIVIHQPNSFHSCWNIGKSSMKSFTISFDGDGLWNLLSSSTFNLKKIYFFTKTLLTKRARILYNIDRIQIVYKNTIIRKDRKNDCKE